MDSVAALALVLVVSEANFFVVGGWVYAVEVSLRFVCGIGQVDRQLAGPQGVALLPTGRTTSRPRAALRGCEAGPPSSGAAAAAEPAALVPRARLACPLPLQGEGRDTQRCFVVTAVRRASI